MRGSDHLRPKRARSLKPLLALGALILLGLFGAFGPLRLWAGAAVSGVAGLGPLGVVLFCITCALTIAAMGPASLFSLSAGYLWGPVGGLVVASVGTTLGAALSFGLGRTVFRDAAARIMRRYLVLRAIDGAIGPQSAGLVFLLRLSPLMPYGPLSWALSATRLRAGPYVLGSWSGALLGTFLYVWVGTTLSSLQATLDGQEGSVPTWGLAVGLVATGLATLGIGRIAQRALAHVMEQQ